VKLERLEWLAESGLHSKRYVNMIGRRCRKETIKDVASSERLNWKTVKRLDTQYMEAQLERFGTPAPRVIGIDEISIRKGHSYQIVVSDIERRRAIWMGGEDRSEKSMDAFYRWLGADKCKKIQLVVMDMWKAFEASALKNIPQAAILYDKFHVMRQLGTALDTVRKQEYRRLSGKRQRFIKGQKYNLLSRKANLKLDGKRSLQKLLSANKRLNTAYVLKESFSQLWGYQHQAWARKFFNNWKESLKWQRLPSFEKFAKMIERHWEGIAIYGNPENDDVSLGFVEGLNNKIRVIQRKSYGLHDKQYLSLKVRTCMLPEI
jgi:transposase